MSNPTALEVAIQVAKHIGVRHEDGGETFYGTILNLKRDGSLIAVIGACDEQNGVYNVEVYGEDETSEDFTATLATFTVYASENLVEELSFLLSAVSFAN